MALSEEEWDEIRELVSETGSLDSDRPVERLIYKLDRLRLKHGEIPLLLSTKADFIDDLDERIKLYKRAVELSLESLDISCLTQSAESLTEIYIEEFVDHENATLWLGKLKEFVSMHGNKYILNSVSDLEAQVNRLRFRSV